MRAWSNIQHNASDMPNNYTYVYGRAHMEWLILRMRAWSNIQHNVSDMPNEYTYVYGRAILG